MYSSLIGLQNLSLKHLSLFILNSYFEIPNIPSYYYVSLEISSRTKCALINCNEIALGCLPQQFRVAITTAKKSN